MKFIKLYFRDTLKIFTDEMLCLYVILFKYPVSTGIGALTRQGCT